MSKIKTSFLVLIPCFITISIFSQDKQTLQSEKLVKKWETDAVFKTPESVCYDQDNKVLYVASINGKSDEKDGNGFISKLSTDGSILKNPWVAGLNGPKGMGIFKGKLYVADIDRVAEIDIASGKILRFFEFPGAKFLNDIAIDNSGAVYISDSDDTKIYRISDGKTEIWLDNQILTSPNGLFVDGNQLMIGCVKIVSAGLEDKNLTVWLDNTGNIDGLEGMGDGRYLYSDWSGNVYLAGKDKKIEKLLDTSPAGINAADIEFIPSSGLLLVPTFRDNRVMAYELK